MFALFVPRDGPPAVSGVTESIFQKIITTFFGLGVQFLLSDAVFIFDS